MCAGMFAVFITTFLGSWKTRAEPGPYQNIAYYTQRQRLHTFPLCYRGGPPVFITPAQQIEMSSYSSQERYMYLHLFQNLITAIWIAGKNGIT
jgi:hypothetical protein